MKSKKSWLFIWSKKTFPEKLTNKSLLNHLLIANGFDHGKNNYNEKSWRALISDTITIAGIKNHHKVLEIGCGCGAFLYELNKVTNCKIYGYDYSNSLIKIAKNHVGENFKVSEAIKNPFSDTNFDFVISHSVFQYFNSYKYALETIEIMKNAMDFGGKIILMDINSKEFEKNYKNERASLEGIKLSEYKKKHENLPNLFINRENLIHDLIGMGFGNISFFNHAVPTYLNAKFRFNLIAEKISG